MVSYDEFLERLFRLNPNGDPHVAYRFLQDVLGYGNLDEEGKEIDFNYIVKKFTEYLNWWNNTFGDREKQFIGKNDLLKELPEWLAEGCYKRRYTIQRKGRDEYLFGSWEKEELERSLQRFIDS